MKRQPWIAHGDVWDDLLSPRLVRAMRPVRLWLQRRKMGLMQIDMRGIEHVEPLLKDGAALLFTPNHPSDPDAFTIYGLADRLGTCFHSMAANHMFAKRNPIERWVLQRHGTFSIDREGSDLRAFRRAVQILQESPYPLVIFPEGEIYRLNDRVTPFRDGPATIALTAARKAKRPVYCVPCGIKYRYLEDPTPILEAAMTDLELRINWRPRHGQPLMERIYKYAEGQMALKELEYLGKSQQGSLRERLAGMREHILTNLEGRYELQATGKTVPERVKDLRRSCLKRLAGNQLSPDLRRQIEIDLDDILLVVQLFSYPGDYIRETPTIERIAETVEKLEEDVLELPYARILGPRRALLALGEPLEVATCGRGSVRNDAPALTDDLEQRVQVLIDWLASGDIR